MTEPIQTFIDALEESRRNMLRVTTAAIKAAEETQLLVLRTIYWSTGVQVLLVIIMVAAVVQGSAQRTIIVQNQRDIIEAQHQTLALMREMQIRRELE